MAKIHIIIGPTASGKSALALSLAEKIGGVIINADSQQLYRDLPILTARPTPEEESRAPHKLYGILNGDEASSAGKWLRLAKMEIDWALSQHVTPIIVGGTGLYIKALMQGIADMPDIAPEVRAQASNDFAAMGKEAFTARLREVDPAFFERLHVVDKQRLIRAYEVWLGSGKPLSFWQEQAPNPPYAASDYTVTRVELPRNELYKRCDARFIRMIEQGAVREVMEWWSGGVVEKNTPLPHYSITPSPLLKIIGVREIISHLQGEITLEAAIQKAQQATRHYAKRQMTWFRNQLP